MSPKTSLLMSTDNDKSFLYDKFLIFDIETTGLSASDDDIIEISAALIGGRTILDRYHSYVNTEKEISKKITAINKITKATIINSPNIDVVLHTMYSKFCDNIYVAHNAHNFDAKFLLNKDRNLFYNTRFLDTIEMAKYLLPGIDGGYSMTNLCKLFGIKINNQHTASGDVDALIVLFSKLSRLLDDPVDISRFIKTGNLIRI